MRTPHLVAAVNLADEGCTLGARLGFFLDGFDRFYDVRITRVVFQLDFVTGLTDIGGAKGAGPFAVKEPFAIRCGAFVGVGGLLWCWSR